jgi:pseudaminic acid biosynthesis-associated methylase
MTDPIETPQLRLWRGDFGAAYIDRNAPSGTMLASLVTMWSRMLERARPAPRRILEVGANVGLNLRALARVTEAELVALEPNAKARQRLVDDKVCTAANVVEGVAQRIPPPDASVDLAFTAGVMIHIAPSDLAACCREMRRVARRHILCAEYFSAGPREIPYRGHDGQLFLRDFGRFWRETCPELKLLDYGFFWTGDGAADDLTWWLFEIPEATKA